MTPWELAREGGLIDQQITQRLHQSLREQAHSHTSTLIAPTDGSRGSELAREGGLTDQQILSGYTCSLVSNADRHTSQSRKGFVSSAPSLTIPPYGLRIAELAYTEVRQLTTKAAFLHAAEAHARV